MPINIANARQLLREANLGLLFIDELGWDRHSGTLDVMVQSSPIPLSAIAKQASFNPPILPPRSRGSPWAHP